MGELFPDEAPDEAAAAETAGDDAPLAFRMRPRTFQEVLGQEALLGEDGPVARAARLGRLPSVILVGPPGSGKTTLASLLASALDCRLVRVSAVSAGVADVRRVVEEARRLRGGAEAPFCSWTRSTTSAGPSRTPSSPTWRAGSSP